VRANESTLFDGYGWNVKALFLASLDPEPLASMVGRAKFSPSVRGGRCALRPVLATIARCVACIVMSALVSCRGQGNDGELADGGQASDRREANFPELCRRFAENINATTCDRFDPADCPRAERDECRDRFEATFRCMVDHAPLRCDEKGELVVDGCEVEHDALVRCVNGDVPDPTCPDPTGCP